MTLQLHRDSFIALAAVAWADGRLSRNESAGLLRAAREHGLGGDDLAAVEAATKEAVSIDSFDATELAEWEKALTFALATWLARLDGVTHPEEQASLHALGDRLGLPQEKLSLAASAAFDIACLPGGHRPEKYDFQALYERLGEKLPSLVSR